MSNHTPKPWRYSTQCDGSDTVDHRTYESPGYFNNLHLVGPDGEFIAGNGEYNSFGSKADRSLIMASPDLFDALYRLLQVVSLAKTAGYIDDEYTRDAIETARSALSRAEGKE